MGRKILPPDAAAWCLRKIHDGMHAVTEAELRELAESGDLESFDRIWDPRLQEWRGVNPYAYVRPHFPGRLRETRGLTPYVQVLSIADGRCCSMCLEMYRRVYKAQESPLAPFHLGCRCRLSLIPYTEAVRCGWAIRTANGGLQQVLESDDLAPGVLSLKTAPPDVIARAVDFLNDRAGRVTTANKVG